MDTKAICPAHSVSKLTERISGDSFLFQFPHDWGTPELLQLAMKAAGSGRRIAVAYASPAASHLEETIALGAGAFGNSDSLGCVTLPTALRQCYRQAVLIYVSCPLDDVRMFQLSLHDENGVVLGEQELREFVESSSVAKSDDTPRIVRLFLPGQRSGNCTFLVESSSHAVRCEALRLLAGRVALATPQNSLSVAPAKAIRQNGADFGVWIDAEGASMQVFDRAGERLAAEQVLLALALHLNAPGLKVTLEQSASASLAAKLRAIGMKVSRSGLTRREMAVSIRRCGAVLGGGASGRIWVGGEIPMCNAILALSLLASGASGYLPQTGPIRALSALAA